MIPGRVTVVALVLALSLAACGDGQRDHIGETRDPCVFLLEFGPRCMPAGKTALCHRPRSVLARSEAPECR